jgi:hypothetical protein
MQSNTKRGRLWLTDLELYLPVDGADSTGGQHGAQAARGAEEGTVAVPRVLALLALADEAVSLLLRDVMMVGRGVGVTRYHDRQRLSGDRPQASSGHAISRRAWSGPGRPSGPIVSFCPTGLTRRDLRAAVGMTASL